MTDPSPSGETWVCRANPAVYGVCTSPIGAIPGHNGCGPVPSSDTPSDERDEVCGSMGPRIGDEPERPRCAQPLDHDGQHRGFPGSGFESVQWGAPIMRDEDFARTYRPAPSTPQPERQWVCHKPGWMGACSPQSTHHNGFDWGCGWIYFPAPSTPGEGTGEQRCVHCGQTWMAGVSW